MPTHFTDKTIAKILQKGFAQDKYMETDTTGVTCLFRKLKDRCICEFLYRRREGDKRVSVKLGVFPELTIDEARAKWLELKQKHEAGIALKPQIKVKKIDLLASTSFGKLWEEWRSLQSINVTFTTEKKYVSMWRSHLHKLEDVDVKELTPSYVLEFLKPIIQTGKYETVRRLSKAISGCLDFAVFKQIIVLNPLLNISKFLPKPEVTHLASFSDETLEQDMITLFNDFSDQSPVLQTLLHMYFYTLLRSVELRSLKISDLHGDYAVVKTKTRKEFKVTLSKQAQQCIQFMIMNKQTKSDYIFEGMAGNNFISDNALNNVLNDKGYKDKLRVHGIRTCGRQWLQTLPEAKESIIELCLSHVVGNRVVQSYNRGDYLEERAIIMQKWCDFVAYCIGQNNAFMFK